MKFANGVNGLVCKFLRLDYNEVLQAEMLVIERIYPIDYRAHEIKKGELWLDVFFDEIHQLHHPGFVHRDIKSHQIFPGSLLIMCCLPIMVSA